MVSRVRTPLLQEAQRLLLAQPRGTRAKLARVLGWSDARVGMIAKGVQPTGSADPKLGSGHQQVQRMVYELRRLPGTGDVAP